MRFTTFVRHRRAQIVLFASVYAMSMPLAVAAETGDTEQGLAEVVVTGTRILQPAGETSASPITVVSSDDIKLTGQVNVEQILNQLPQVFAGNTSNSNLPSAGTGGGIVTLDLRALGPNRNLVLIDGRRLTPSRADGTADVNNVPVDMLERVETVTGGASSTYGSDAISGVINFILKKNFVGLEVKAGGGVSTYGDGTESNVSILSGTPIGNGGNLMLNATFNTRSGTLEDRRTISQIDTAAIPGEYSTSKSGFPWEGGANGTVSIINNGNNRSPKVPTGIILGDGTPCDSIPIFFVTGGSRTLVPTATGVRGFCAINSAFGGDKYNFAAHSDLILPQHRENLSAVGYVPLSSLGAEAYFEAFYVHNVVHTQEGGFHYDPVSNITISPTSPLLNAATRAALAARPDPSALATVAGTEPAFGNATDVYTTDYINVGGGLRGDLSRGWHWDLYADVSHVRFTDLTHAVAQDRLQAEFNNCPAGSPAGCVGQSPFLPYSPASLAYVGLPNVTDTTSYDRQDLSLDLSGSLFDLPAGAVKAAVGTEVRRDAVSYQPDPEKQANGGQGNVLGAAAALPVSGSYTVGELYGETQAPLLNERFGIKSLTLLAGVRGSDYSTSGLLWTDKLGIEMEPADTGLRFRAMYQNATRAPSLAELFATPSKSAPGITDPCAARNFDGTAPTQNRCNGTTPVLGVNGVPIAPVDPNTFRPISTQGTVYSLGNQNLKPEKAHTLTLGGNWRPEFAPGFYTSLDFYRIKIDDYISTEFGTYTGIANACFQAGNTTACSLLSRDAAGTLVIGSPTARVGAAPKNGASLRTSGEDLYISYRLQLGDIGGSSGHLSFAANINHLDTWVYTALDGTTTQCAGILCSPNNLRSQPRWRAIVSETYEAGPLSLQWRSRYVGKVTDSANGIDYLAILNGGSYATIGSYLYHDLAASFGFTPRVSLTLSVQNVFNKTAPLLYDAGGQDGTDNALYDVVGRYFRITVAGRF